jgi:hypothetical protein
MLPAVNAEPVDAKFGAADEARFEVGSADAGSGEGGAQVEAELSNEGFRGTIDVAVGIGVGGSGAAEIDDAARLPSTPPLTLDVTNDKALS